MEDLTGKQLDAYQVVTPLGKGGMGVVYKAYDTKLRRYVALKVLPRRYTIDKVFVSRFWQEATAAANLDHPHILQIYAYGEHDGYHYIAMQLVREGSLAQLLHGQPLLQQQMRYIIIQVGGALDYAHSRGVIHRDVKPDNILISRQNGCLLTDFGIAKLLESTTRYTQTGTSIGTPTYMSPEQINAEEDLDGRSDIYSLGVVLYEMATGHPPFGGPVDMIKFKHLYELPPAPQNLNPTLPGGVVDVILKALAKKREERYATARDMVQALQETIPAGWMADAEVGAAILGAASDVTAVDDQEAEAAEPIDNEELTAVLAATTAEVPIEQRRQEGDDGQEPPRSLQAAAPQPQAKEQTQVDSPQPVINQLKKIPVIGWVAALMLMAAVVAAIIWLGGQRDHQLSTPTSQTVIVGAVETETPRAPLSRAPITATPQPTVAPTVTPRSELVATDTPTANWTPVPTDTAKPEASPSNTATLEPIPTDTPTMEPAPVSNLTGRLAIPLMYGNEPKVYIVSTSGELQGVVGAARQPDYSRDGTKLVVNGDWGQWDKLRVLNPAEGGPFEIGDPALAGHTYPSWSPDGSEVIYEDGTVDPKGWRIFTRDLKSSGPATGPGTILKAGIGRGELIGRYPLWTVQDRYIFLGCNTWEAGQESDCGIWVMQGNNGTPQKLTDNPNHVPTDVHDNTVVYVSAEKGDWSVYTLDIVSGASRQITEGGVNDGLATISPDGRTVAFLSAREGKLGVWYVDIQGGSAQKFFDIPTNEWGQLRVDGWSEEKLSWGTQ